ncbi:MAG: peptide chain release factor 1 [bacterium]
MIERRQIERMLERLQVVEAALTDPAVLNSPRLLREKVREHAAYKRLDTLARDYFRILDEIPSSRQLAQDESADPDLRGMARAEVTALEARLPQSERDVLYALLPPDPADERNAVVEIRAGTGGEEAALFAADLFRMYSRYCETKRWKISMLDSSASDMGGYKEIVFQVTATGAYGMFRFESGGHRVQRVPATEAQGRIHTSAATVGVFPEAEAEDDIDIPASELRIDIFCAGGKGGQSVNTTYSAIRMTHLPTGLVAQCQDERSQLRNKEKALAVLKSRLLDQRRQAEAAKQGKTRRDLIGSGDRSQRIRTYNFPQNRMTDHRINLTLYSLDRIIAGALDHLFEALQRHDLGQRLESELGITGLAAPAGAAAAAE